MFLLSFVIFLYLPCLKTLFVGVNPPIFSASSHGIFHHQGLGVIPSGPLKVFLLSICSFWCFPYYPVVRRERSEIHFLLVITVKCVKSCQIRIFVCNSSFHLIPIWSPFYPDVWQIWTGFPASSAVQDHVAQRQLSFRKPDSFQQLSVAVPGLKGLRWGCVGINCEFWDFPTSKSSKSWMTIWVLKPVVLGVHFKKTAICWDCITSIHKP